MAGGRSQCLMPDADVIIFLHVAGLWEAVATDYQVVVPSIIAHEAQFYLDDKGDRHPIDLASQIGAARIVELSASTAELRALQRHFAGDLLEGLHPGEQEALALILSGAFAEGRLCSGDHVALVALAALGFESRGVSLERALRDIGRSFDRTLRRSPQLTQTYFERAVAEGKQRRISGEGLTSSLFDSL